MQANGDAAAILRSVGCIHDHLPRAQLTHRRWQMSMLLLFVSRVTARKMHSCCRVGTMARHLGLVEAQALDPATSRPKQRQASGDGFSRTCLSASMLLPTGLATLVQAFLIRHCTLLFRLLRATSWPRHASNLWGLSQRPSDSAASNPYQTAV